MAAQRGCSRAMRLFTRLNTYSLVSGIREPSALYPHLSIARHRELLQRRPYVANTKAAADLNDSIINEFFTLEKIPLQQFESVVNAELSGFSLGTATDYHGVAVKFIEQVRRMKNAWYVDMTNRKYHPEQKAGFKSLLATK